MKHVTWTAGIIFLLDRVSKYAAQNLPAGKVFSFAPDIDFGYFPNPALFFFPAWRWIPWVALTVLVALFGFLIWNLIGNWELGIGNFLRHPLFPILLGGASNVFDRFAYGGVIDIIHIGGLATINLADILIGLGIVLFLIRHFEERSDEKSHTLP